MVTVPVAVTAYNEFCGGKIIIVITSFLVTSPVVVVTADPPIWTSFPTGSK